MSSPMGNRISEIELAQRLARQEREIHDTAEALIEDRGGLNALQAQAKDAEMSQEDIDYLYDLAERLMRVPALYGVDQSDVDRLISIAAEKVRVD